MFNTGRVLANITTNVLVAPFLFEPSDLSQPLYRLSFSPLHSWEGENEKCVIAHTEVCSGIVVCSYTHNRLHCT